VLKKSQNNSYEIISLLTNFRSQKYLFLIFMLYHYFCPLREWRIFCSDEDDKSKTFD